jgi:hypothetical protein
MRQMAQFTRGFHIKVATADLLQAFLACSKHFSDTCEVGAFVGAGVGSVGA